MILVVLQQNIRIFYFIPMRHNVSGSFCMCTNVKYQLMLALSFVQQQSKHYLLVSQQEQ